MTKFDNPLAPKFGRLMNHSAQIKAWVREARDLPEDTPITVAELACRDEGCPDIETVIGILEVDKPIVTLRLHAKMTELSRDDVLAIACNV